MQKNTDNFKPYDEDSKGYNNYDCEDEYTDEYSQDCHEQRVIATVIIPFPPPRVRRNVIRYNKAGAFFIPFKFKDY